MKGVIIVPTLYKKRHDHPNGRSANSKVLFDALSKTYKMPVVYTDDPDLSNYDVALIYAVPYHNRPVIPQGLLDTKCKLIGYLADLQCYTEECFESKKVMFEKYDMIIGSYYYKFRLWYPQFVDKYVYYPNFFSPHARYSKLGIRLNPEKRAVLSGTKYAVTYPDRDYLARTIPVALMRVRTNKVAFAKYPEFLNSHICGVVFSGSYDIATAKYLEVPASGCLMLGKTIPELELLGLIPGTHYVPVTLKNVENVIKDVIANPKKYAAIRKAGMIYTRKYHSELSRVQQFGEILNKLNES